MSVRVLVIATNHGELAGEPNGTYMPELTHALHVLEEQGIAYDLASPKGGELPGYGKEADDLTKQMLANEAFAERLRTTRRLSDIDPDGYDAVFYPGGYGLLFDLADDADSQRIAASLYQRGAPVAAVCHGPAALLGVALADGRPLVADRHVTGFTRGEEVAMKTLDKIPFVLENRLLEAGAVYRKRKNWQALVIEDGHLITGQNPGSARGVGEALARQLSVAR